MSEQPNSAPILSQTEREEQIRQWLDLYREFGITEIFLPSSNSMERASLPATDGQEPPSYGIEDSSSNQQNDLERLRTHDLGICTRCKLHKGRKTIVFGEGNATAELMLVGEAPGADEDIQGRPFVGRAGQLLMQMIKAIHFERSDVFIANVLKCRPPGNRAPEPDEIQMCSPFLWKQISIIQPKVILALGTFAAQTLIGSKSSISFLRNRVYELPFGKVIATYHPSFLLRSPQKKPEAWEDLKLVSRTLSE